MKLLRKLIPTLNSVTILLLAVLVAGVGASLSISEDSGKSPIVLFISAILLLLLAVIQFVREEMNHRFIHSVRKSNYKYSDMEELDDEIEQEYNTDECCQFENVADFPVEGSSYTVSWVYSDSSGESHMEASVPASLSLSERNLDKYIDDVPVVKKKRAAKKKDLSKASKPRPKKKPTKILKKNFKTANKKPSAKKVKKKKK